MLLGSNTGQNPNSSLFNMSNRQQQQQISGNDNTSIMSGLIGSNLNSNNPMNNQNTLRMMNDTNTNVSYDNNSNFSLLASTSGRNENMISRGGSSGNIGLGSSVNSMGGMLFNNANINQMLNSNNTTNNNGIANSMSGMSLSQIQHSPSMLSAGVSAKDMDFTILNEDFPALPGAQQAGGSGGLGTIVGSSMSQKGDMQSGIASLNMMTATQDNLNNNLQSYLQSQGQGGPSTANNHLSNLGTISRGSNNISVGPNPGTIHSQHSSQQASQSQMNSSMLSGMGIGLGNLGNLGVSTTDNLSQSMNQLSLNGGSPPTAPSGGGNMSKEAKYGLAGLLDVIRMTDKVCIIYLYVDINTVCAIVSTDFLLY